MAESSYHLEENMHLLATKEKKENTRYNAIFKDVYIEMRGFLLV